jgi:hypothetical protein
MSKSATADFDRSRPSFETRPAGAPQDEVGEIIRLFRERRTHGMKNALRIPMNAARSFLLPAGLPADTLNRLNTELRAIVAEPRMSEELAGKGF